MAANQLPFEVDPHWLHPICITGMPTMAYHQSDLPVIVKAMGGFDFPHLKIQVKLACFCFKI